MKEQLIEFDTAKLAKDKGFYIDMHLQIGQVLRDGEQAHDLLPC